MNCFFKAKTSRFCVANFENSGLFSAICALNQRIPSPEKFNSDLIRASFLNREGVADQIALDRVTQVLTQKTKLFFCFHPFRDNL
jgi:hypothetical protein